MQEDIKLPRLNVELHQDMHDALKEYLPGRTKSDAVRALLTILLKEMDTQGGNILFELLNHNVTLRPIDKDG